MAKITNLQTISYLDIKIPKNIKTSSNIWPRLKNPSHVILGLTTIVQHEPCKTGSTNRHNYIMLKMCQHAMINSPKTSKGLSTHSINPNIFKDSLCVLWCKIY
jgi:hypothetical protein